MKHNYKIVTDGRKFRLQHQDGGFWEEWHSCPEGPGYTSVWQTRFYLRACKKLGNLKRAKIRNEMRDEWVSL